MHDQGQELRSAMMETSHVLEMTYPFVKLCWDLGGQERAKNNVGFEFDKLGNQVRGAVRTLGSWIKDLDSDVAVNGSPLLQSSIDELGERVDARD
jgi:hypothetical protein